MTFCMAPFTHTYCSPQGERRMCCAAREQSQNFRQYIDSDQNSRSSNEFHIMSLDEHWNSEHMKDVRRRMIAGETLPECEVCDAQLLNTDTYRGYFDYLFGHMKDAVLAHTDPDGTCNLGPISFDYRFSNLCNFKCRMCGPQLSSKWMVEAEKFNTNFDQSEPWYRYRNEIENNQNNMFWEMKNASKYIRELYWAGGEPLMFYEHWRIMDDLIECDQSENIYVRYNTNLSRITPPESVKSFSGALRFEDITVFDMLEFFKDWQICASLDGTGEIGEYIRTGLRYERFIENFEKGLAAQTKPGQMRLDFTITTPGLFEIRNMFELSKKYNCPLLTKVCFEFSPEVAMCPLWLPKSVLHPILDELIEELGPKADRNQYPLIEMLKNLRARPTMEDKYENYEEGRFHGKYQIEKLERIRIQPITLAEIFHDHCFPALDFWRSIPRGDPDGDIADILRQRELGKVEK